MIDNSFQALDWIILAGYFLILVISSIFLTRKQLTSKDYFLADGNIPVFAAAISFLATALSAATFIGAPQQSFTGDLTYLSSNLGSILAIFVVALIFIPAFYRNKVSTVYELLRIRYGEPSSIAASGAFLLGRVFASGARLYIVALPASMILFGDIAISHQLISIAVLTFVGIIYTYAGGIRTVIWTDVIQTMIFVGAACIIIGILLHKIPIGIGEIIDALSHPGDGESSKLSIMPFGSGGFGPEHTFTFLTAILGFSLLSLGAYGTDQDMAQRLLTLKNAAGGKRSAIAGVFIGIPVTLLFMIIGLLLYIFYTRPDIMGSLIPTGYDITSSKKIFLTFIIEETAPGVTGLMMAGLFAAGLSSLNSAINAMSSAFINDFYKRIKPEQSEKHYLKIGRRGVMVFGVILGVFAVLSVFWLEARPGTTLINFALLVMVFAYSGLVAVYLAALLTKRGNDYSVVAALISGFILVVIMQTYFNQSIAFPWQMFIATWVAFLICISGRPTKPHNLL
ncbi:sodium:solute symporter [bacterium]|nr:sodium:solute symporter [bacterium]